MRKLIFIMLFIPFSVLGKDEDGEKIYSFLNQVIDQWNANNRFDGTPPYYIINEPDFEYFNKYLLQTDSLYLLQGVIKSPISKTDSIYIFERAKTYKKFSFEDRLSGAKLIPRKSVNRAFNRYGSNGWWHLRKSTGASAYISISVPIFFDNGTKAIFYHGYHCDGLCGGGDVSVYENVNGVWTKKVIVLTWHG